MLWAVINFGSLTPLEYISVAARERVHTETLRWLLSKDSPLPAPSRMRLLDRLCGLPDPESGTPDLREIVEVETEKEHVDLWIGVRGPNRGYSVVIENKLKSREHSDQLTRYDGHLKAGDVRLFLTLIGERPRANATWFPLTYDKMAQALDTEIRQVKAREERLPHAEFLADYQALLSRLVYAAALVTTESDMYAGHSVVFATKTIKSPPADFAEYVVKLKLRTILQKAWMLKLGLETFARLGDPPGWKWEIGETHGAGLLTCKIHWAGSQVSGTGRYDIGVQVQHDVFKFFCQPHPYGEPVTTDQNAEIRTILTAVQLALPHGVLGFSSPKRLGFSSFGLPFVSEPPTRSIPAWTHQLAEHVRRLQSVI